MKIARIPILDGARRLARHCAQALVPDQSLSSTSAPRTPESFHDEAAAAGAEPDRGRDRCGSVVDTAALAEAQQASPGRFVENATRHFAGQAVISPL
jgi:hypothetical protein